VGQLPVFKHARTVLYLVAAGIIWFAEDVVFTRGLGFDAAQTSVVTTYFVLLFAVAIWFIVRTYRRGQSRPASEDEPPLAKVISMAPALTLIIGSFAALPVIILVLMAGSIL
jgi:ABC-type nickel/cobalt efflux system permease component RcnA